MPTIPDLPHLPEHVRAAVNEFLDGAAEALGANLLGAALYGSAARGDYNPGLSDVNLMMFVERLEADGLRRLLAPVARARALRLAPFFLARAELPAAAAAFPAKFMTIREEHRALRGEDLLAGLEINRAHLRMRCQQEAINMLLHLRRRYLLQGGHGLAELVGREAGSFLDTLRAALTLLGEPFHARADAIEPAARRFGFDGRVLREIAALRTANPPLPPERAEALFAQWLDIIAAVQAKLECIDQVI